MRKSNVVGALVGVTVIALLGAAAVVSREEFDSLENRVQWCEAEIKLLRKSISPTRRERESPKARKLSEAKGPNGKEDKQAQRRKLIDELIAKGVFAKITKRTKYPRIWVTPLFHSLSYDEKNTLVSLVYAYYLGPETERGTVFLIDDQTGKDVGQFTLPPSGHQGPLKLK